MSTEGEILDAFVAKLPGCTHVFMPVPGDGNPTPCPRKATCLVSGLRYCDEHGNREAETRTDAGAPRQLGWAREIRLWEKLRAKAHGKAGT